MITMSTPTHAQTLARSLERRGDFSEQRADGVALLEAPPCWHLAVFQSNRLVRFMALTRSNLRHAFGQECGDDWMARVLARRRAAR
jgi:hypothetical protein